MEDYRMTFISTYGNITCREVTGRTREEEKALRASYTVKQSVKNAQNQDKKKQNYYRLVNGRPAGGQQQSWRENEWLEPSGFFLLDYDLFEKWKDGTLIRKKMTATDVWNRMKSHTKEWGIVHAEKSARGGLHVTLIRTEGLSIEENIRLMELRAGVGFDPSCKDLARACFLVPNEYVFFETDTYYEDSIPQPLTLSAADAERLEKDRLEREQKHQQEVEERRKNAPTLRCEAGTDDVAQLRYVIDLIYQQGVDLTCQYHNWIVIGLIIAHIMGMAGEPLFHQVSSLYPRYDWMETHRKYRELASRSRGEVTLGTLIYLSRNEGVVN